MFAEMQMTVEQHGFERHGFTYMWIFYSVLNTTILHYPGLVESADVEPQVWRANYLVILRFFTMLRVGIPNPQKVEGQL